MKPRSLKQRWAIAIKAGICAALLPLLAAVGFAALAASFALPNDPIRASLLDRPDDINTRRASNGRVIDADTECIGLSVGLYGVEASRSAFYNAAHAKAVFGCGPFMDYLNGQEPRAYKDYFRYWHGYLVLARPLLSVLPYADVRGVYFHISLILFLSFLSLIGRDFGLSAALAFAAPFVVLNALGFWVVATKAPTFWLAVSGALFVRSNALKTGSNHQQADAWRLPSMVFFFLGAGTAYFDFLTAPALIFSLTAFVHFLYQRAEMRAREACLRFALFAGFFALGYAGLWALKIAIAAALLDLPVWADVGAAVHDRTRGVSGTVERLTPGLAIWKNFGALKTVWGAVFMLAFMVAPLVRPSARIETLALANRSPGLVLAALAPIVWLELLSNHSQIHAAFTHLNFAPFAILSGLALAGPSAPGKTVMPR
ncbi:MAG: hypothetical protein AAF850_00415 [Pseudomonadota bacterium]